MASWAELNSTLRAALPASRSARAEQAPRATTPAGVPQPSTRAKANGCDMVVESPARTPPGPPGRPSSSGISSAASTRAASRSTGSGSRPATRAAAGAASTSRVSPAMLTVVV